MIRVIAGEWRGRRISTPPGGGTRPTSEKVRGAVFNVLHARMAIENAVVWDLFAGSGALGIEALSRGARHVHFVESDARAAALIRETLKALLAPAERWTVATARVDSWLAHAPAPAAPLIVLMDPPYSASERRERLVRLAGMESVPRGTVIVLESALHAAPEVPPGLELVQSKRYGGTGVQFMVKDVMVKDVMVDGAPQPAHVPPETVSDESSGDERDP